MTDLLYLLDAYQKEMDAMILQVTQEGDKKWRVILDQTVFYPMGGGQPTDQGILSSDQWTGKVYQVLQKGDQTIHYVEADHVPPMGTDVQGVIDWDRRYNHMKIHSAGHVVDFALYLLGFSPSPLMPFKGDHGKKPVIWYQGTVEKDFREELEQKANELIAKDLLFSFRLVTHEELEKKAIYMQPGLPTNKPLRLMTLEGVGSVADGGTQVRKTGEIVAITIPSIERKDGMTAIHYRVV